MSKSVVTKHKFAITINGGEENGEYIINLDGEYIGIKLLAYYDEDNKQIIDVIETGGRSQFRFRYNRLKIIADEMIKEALS